VSARTLLLWRHGRTEYNASARLQGQVDIPLDDVGGWQAGQAAEDIARRHRPTRIVTSDLGRAVATAQALGDLVGVDVEVDERVRERAFGEWEGLTSEEIAARWPEEHRVWRSGGDPARDGAETRREVAERMVEAVEDHAARTPDDGTLVVVSHGAAITLGLTALLGLDAVAWRGIVGLHNAHWATLQFSRSGRPAWRMESHNLGPSVRVEDWQAGVPTEDLPSSTADALRT
jgi:glucosyl-3-phosphoglycerate phosphatase